MGIVYKAHDADLDRVVALKVIKGGVTATDEEIVRFHREAQTAARLHHPNIIPVYEIGQESGCLYFTMPFASGGSLAEHRQRFTNPRAAAALLEQVARAVHYSHQHGILHRDLKPANILFDERGNALVSDFGLAKFLDADLELTRTGQVLGTPAYMAPEQASGQTAQIAASTDVWALGVLLYELVTGQRPFQGGSQEEQLQRVRTTEPLRPRSVNRSLDHPLETVILKCLEKEPSRRYASAEALADDLARWLRGEPVLARPPSRLVRAGRALRRYRVLGLRMVFAAVLLVLVVLAWRGRSSSVPPAEEGDRKAMEEKFAQLKRGEKVTLLPESGPPVWQRWQPSRRDARTMLDMNGVFRIYAGKHPGMLELLPSTPKRYRLRAEVQHTNSQTLHGKVGIYFAHGKRATEEGTTHCFFRVDFNDRVPTGQPVDKALPPVGQVRLTLPIYRQTKETVFFHQIDLSPGVVRQFKHAGQAESMPWRTLEVEVTPESIKTSWEGELIKTKPFGEEGESGAVDPQKVLEMASSVFSGGTMRPKGRSNEQVVPSAELALGEGMGLYVEQAVAAFRSVVIEPLPPK